jgi:hypothetical protein
MNACCVFVVSTFSKQMPFTVVTFFVVKGWVTRRKEEKAKTIAQIHKEVAKEEAQAARRSGSSNNMQGRGNNNRDNSSSSLRGSGTGDVRNLQRSGSTSGKAQAKTIVDQDGFVQVSKGMGRPNPSASSYKKSSRKQQGSFASEQGHTKSSDKKAGKKMQRELVICYRHNDSHTRSKKMEETMRIPSIRDVLSWVGSISNRIHIRSLINYYISRFIYYILFYKLSIHFFSGGS